MLAWSRHSDKAAPLLPPGAVEFGLRRIEELAGTALFCAGLALAIALASFHQSDPSWNTSVPGTARNLLGGPGAVAADALLQALGLAASLLPAVLLAWGWRLGTHRGVERPWLRLAALAPALLLFALALAPIAVPAAWPLAAGLGGFAGDALHAELGARATGLLGGWVYALTAAAALLALLAALFVIGLSAGEWRALARGAWRSAAFAGRSGIAGGALALRAARRLYGAARRERPERREPRIETAPRLAAGDDDARPRRRLPPPVEPAPSARKPAPQARRAGDPRQATLDLGPGEEYRLPPLDLLDPPPAAARAGAVNEEALTQNARMLEGVLDDFGVRGRIVKVRPGPVVALYELEPAPGTKSSRVVGLADDIARSMSAVSVRVAVVPGRNVIGIELPNATRELVMLRELLGSSAYERTAAQLTLALGKDIGGAPVMADLARMPHLLIAGTTGSGKSVAINTMILSLLYRLPPDLCKFIMIDPKMLELSVYDGIPHLLAPVVTDPSKAVIALRWAVREMEQRYRAMSHLGVRNVASYNARLAEARRRGETLTRTVQTGFDPETGAPVMEEQPLDLNPLPLVVIIVDEMADLMLVAGKDVEAAVQRLAQMARAAGIHLIMATQRPSVDVITGTIKANFPTRVSFQVTSKIDSRTILGEGGAEQLLGQGDMLYMAAGGRLGRVHGPLVTDQEVERVVAFLRAQGEPSYVEAVTEEEAGAEGFGPLGGVGGGSGEDALYDQAVALVCRERKASTSFVQRYLQIGYNRAARLIERMEAEGVVSRANAVGKREVLARNIEDPAT